MKIITALFLWALVIGGSIFLYKSLHFSFIPFGWQFNLPTMPGHLVLLFALSIAFMWVEVLHWGTVRPFTCIKCMSGWFSLGLAYAFHTEFWYLYLPAGLLVGALFTAIKGRYL